MSPPVPPHLVAHLPGLLRQRVVLVLVLLDVLRVSQCLHMEQLLVGQLQLLLVVAVLLHLGLKVPQLLLNTRGTTTTTHTPGGLGMSLSNTDTSIGIGGSLSATTQVYAPIPSHD